MWENLHENEDMDSCCIINQFENFNASRILGKKILF